MKKLLSLLVLASLVLTLLPVTAFAAPLPQEEGQSYVIQKADWLSKLAEKYLGNVNAWPAIMLATNKMAETDSSFAKIENPDVIEPGWKVWIPGTKEAETLLAEYKPAAAPVGKLKIAFVYVGPLGDLGWNYAQDVGRKMIEQKFGNQVETTYIENVPEGPEAERVIRDFAQKGYKLIFTTSFGFMDPTIAVAKEFPNTWFVHISGYKTAENVSTVFGRMEQPRYLSGLVAGKATKSNIVGYVAAFPIPEVIRGINAFTLGVREANPEAEVRVVWTNTWFDPPKEKEAADALLDQGADVIAQHQDTTEPQKAAKDKGVVSIGYDSDMAAFVGDTVLTSPVWNWGVKYVDIAKRVMDGTYASEAYYGGLKEGVVGLAPLSPRVPDDVKALVEQKKNLMISGEWNIFCGPVKASDGRVVVPEGYCMTDPEILSMDWWVEGVKGEVPGTAPEKAGEPRENVLPKTVGQP
jgi:basic membrane protein A